MERPRLSDAPPPRSGGAHGLSWAAFFNRWLIIGLLVGLAVGWWALDFNLPSVSLYYFVGIVGAALFWPFLVAVHKASAQQLVVYDGPGRVTVFRIGRRYSGFEIEGNPVNLVSRSGIQRLFVTDFDVDTGKANGGAFAHMTHLDYLADARTFDHLNSAYITTLEGDRLSHELVAAKAQELVKELAKRWVNIGIASVDPAPIEAELEALALMRTEGDDKAERVEELDDWVDDL